MGENEKAEIGVIGGSGIYELLEKPRHVKVGTPYGHPSDLIAIGEIAGRKVAFLPRHGRHHQYPPHRIPYRANLWAFHLLGVKRIIAPCAVGSLQPHVKRGDIVVCDQFVDRTKLRPSSFYDGPETVHVSMADPYCPELRSLSVKVCRELGLSFHEKGTVVVVEGPRFSTRAESRWYKGFGWETINMTVYPEVVLARELEICYVNLAMVTDYDVWAEAPVSAEEVRQTLIKHTENFKKILERLIPSIPSERRCPCAAALRDARI
ncbi:MAG: S-methyl-5'-thioadenosine phosphorylase [Candidatus Hecatellales archaeon]|nr:MAG: S-methyl-5'-thioadenosine phosphorylase [Candidatus Hecatellales archaeon]